jgi:6-phosphogluconolactonase
MIDLKAHVETLADPAALAERVAAWLLDLALAKQGDFSLCLSGGSTPTLLYRRLAQAPYLGAFPWARTHLFWGDERFVPPSDARSNYSMVHEALLAHVPIPPANIHSIATVDLSPEAAAAAYQLDLQAFYGASRFDPARPLFDVNLLGLGTDGHTASLFPHTPMLEERTLWVAAVLGVKAEARITLTYPVLDSSRHAAFLVAGGEKTEILSRLIKGDQSLPAARLNPMGRLWIFCDQAAQAPA